MLWPRSFSLKKIGDPDSVRPGRRTGGDARDRRPPGCRHRGGSGLGPGRDGGVWRGRRCAGRSRCAIGAVALEQCGEGAGGRRFAPRRGQAGHDIRVAPPRLTHRRAVAAARVERPQAAAERQNGARQRRPLAMAGSDALVQAHPGDAVAERAANEGDDMLG